MNSLIQTTPAVALISLGNPYLLRNFPGVSAYLATFSPSDTSEIAAAKAMLGRNSDSGPASRFDPGIGGAGDGIQVTNLGQRHLT